MKILLAEKSELELNSMKKIEANSKEILLIRTIDDNFFATGSKCTHFGAPLETGVLSNDRIVCPCHHACFNCTNGKMIEPPALDDLKKYPLTIEDEKIYVEISDKESDSAKAKFQIDDERTFIIIGGGAAGSIAAKTLRDEGFKGKIILISKDSKEPYDRTNLSKAFLSGNVDQEDLPLKSESFYDDLSIELMLNIEIVNLDILTKRLELDNGKNLKYDKILIATGGKPQFPLIPGSELKNVFTLRNYEDAQTIINKSKNSKKCVVIGSSFIAMETASSMQEHNVEITVVTQDSLPFESIFGEEVGELFFEAHKKNNTNFIVNDEPVRLLGSDKIEGVELKSGDVVDTEMVVVGVGVKPATDFIKGLNKMPDNSIEVDQFFNAGKDVFAAGDIATFPYWRENKKIRIEHWRTALQQGKIAAQNMLGKKTKFNSIPFFWTRQAGLNLQYVGHAPNWDQIYIDGSINENNFLAYYVTAGKINAFAGMGKSKELAAIEELMRLDKMPENAHLSNGSFEPVEVLNKITNDN